MRQVLVEAGPVETRAALQQAGRIRSLWIGPAFTDPLPPMAGERLAATIRTIDPRLGAAFCTLSGIEGQGFLPLPRKQGLSEGQDVVVEVRREAVPGKLAQLRLSADQRPPAGERPGVLAHAVTALCGSQSPERIRLAGPTQALLQLKAGVQDIPVSPCDMDVLEKESAEESFEAALARYVSLPGGARLAFDEAAALSAIDIDIAAAQGQSKKGAARRACLAAIPVITAQIALRRLGGQIVIDFPLRRADAGEIEAALKAAIAERLPEARLDRLSQGGLVALTLPKTGPSLLESVTQTGSEAPVPGRRYTARHLAARALRAAERALSENTARPVALYLPGEIADLLSAQPDWTQALCEKYGNRLRIERDAEQERDWHDVVIE